MYFKNNSSAKKSVILSFIFIEIAKITVFIWRKPTFWQFFGRIFGWHSFYVLFGIGISGRC
jgi:hypothetical protein